MCSKTMSLTIVMTGDSESVAATMVVPGLPRVAALLQDNAHVC